MSMPSYGALSRVASNALVFALLLAPAHLPAQAPGRAARADAYLDRLRGFGFSGSMLIARGDEILVAKGYGLADRERNIAFSARTRSDIGSITKQFTATAILRLAADGKLTVHDSIGRFFSHVPADKRGITLHHLLTHTSGLSEAQQRGDYSPLTRDSMVALTMAAAVLHAPGEHHSYSNVGYSLLAAIVERVSGASFESFLEERLFEPAGLQETGYSFPADDRTRHSVGYRGAHAWGRSADTLAAMRGDAWNLVGNGGIISSVTDLHRWARALSSGRVIPPEMVAELMTPHVLVFSDYRERGATLHYGYGWYVWQPRGRTIVFHNGDGAGGTFFSSLWLYRDEGLILAYNSNVREFAAARARPIDALNRILLGDRVGMPPVVRPIDPDPHDDRAGRYKDTGGTNTIAVRGAGDALEMQGIGQAAFAMLTSGAWVVDPVLDSLNARAAAFMTLSRDERIDELAPFLRSDVALGRIRDVESRFWRSQEAQHGPYRGMRVLGTRRSHGLAAPFPATTFVEFQFAGGSVYRDFIWDATRRIIDYGLAGDAPTGRFLPVSADCVASFDSMAAIATCVCFRRVGGTVAIEVMGPTGPVRLRKTD